MFTSGVTKPAFVPFPQVYGVLWNPFSSTPEFVTYGVKHILTWRLEYGARKVPTWTKTAGTFGAAKVMNVLACTYVPDPMKEWRDTIRDKDTGKVFNRGRAKGKVGQSVGRKTNTRCHLKTKVKRRSEAESPVQELFSLVSVLRLFPVLRTPPDRWSKHLVAEYHGPHAVNGIRVARYYTPGARSKVRPSPRGGSLWRWGMRWWTRWRGLWFPSSPRMASATSSSRFPSSSFAVSGEACFRTAQSAWAVRMSRLHTH
eukprot:8948724-Pyramimonas_sp.AAC.1